MNELIHFDSRMVGYVHAYAEANSVFHERVTEPGRFASLLMIGFFSVNRKTVRKLMFITVPMETSSLKIFFGCNNAECLPAFVAYGVKCERDWDIIDIDEQNAGVTSDRVHQELVSPYIEMINADWQGFVVHLWRIICSNINMLRRYIAKLGDIFIRRVNQWPKLGDAMDIYCEIESRSWKFYKSSHIVSERVDYFFYAGKPIASTLGIRSHNVFQSLKIAHDQPYDRFARSRRFRNGAGCSTMRTGRQKKWQESRSQEKMTVA